MTIFSFATSGVISCACCRIVLFNTLFFSRVSGFREYSFSLSRYSASFQYRSLRCFLPYSSILSRRPATDQYFCPDLVSSPVFLFGIVLLSALYKYKFWGVQNLHIMLTRPFGVHLMPKKVYFRHNCELLCQKRFISDKSGINIGIIT